jgi:hypothetical protein
MLNISALHSSGYHIFSRGYRSAANLAKRKIPRRTMLALSGGALGLTAAIDCFGDGQTSEIQFNGNSKRVHLRVGNLDWLIETDWFAGQPELIVNDGQEFSLSLKNALYPGTNLSADFSCLLTRQGSDWRMGLRLACADLMLSGSFTRWLRNTFAAANITRREEKFSIVGGIEATLPQGSNLLFSPDFTLIANSMTARLRSRDFSLTAQQLNIGLLRPGTPTILQKTPARRTLVSVERGQNRWEVNLHPLVRNELEVTEPTQLFEIAHFEIGETTQKISKGAMLFESSPEQPTADYAPGEDFRSDGMEKFVLALKQVKYARTLNDKEDQVVLTALFSDQEKKLHAGEFGLVLGNGDKSPPFELIIKDDRTTKFCCEPQVLAYNAPIPDGSVEYSRPRPGLRAVFLNSDEPTTDFNQAVIRKVASGVQASAPLMQKRIVRTDDLLVIDFTFVNLSLFFAPGKNARVVLTESGKPGIITMNLPPQQIAEQAFPEQSLPTKLPIKSRISGPTRLSFILSPADAQGFDYTLEDLLRVCRNGQLKIKLPSSTASEPAPDETAIEAPLRLILSPAANAGWKHELAPVTQFGQQPPTPPLVRSELWHTRLGVRTGDLINDNVRSSDRPLQAIWSRRQTDPDPDGFDIPLKANDRAELVKLTFEQALAPIKTERLILSSLGAWMKVDYDFTAPGFALEYWRHEMAQSRDQYVNVIHRGYLYPWRHRASHIQIYERRFRKIGTETAAIIIKKEFLIIREKTVSYDPTRSPFGGRKMLREVTFLEDQPIRIIRSDIITSPENYAFWPDVPDATAARRHYLFRASVLDYKNVRSSFLAGAIFVRADKVEVDSDLADAGTIKSAYTDDQSLYARYSDLRSQELAFADWPDNSNTVIETSRITFSTESVPPTSLPPAERKTPKFYPVIDLVEGKLPALKHLRDKEPALNCKFNPTYLADGFVGNNKGNVFLDILNPAQLDFHGEANEVGAFVSLRTKVIALSALTGIVGGNHPTSLKEFIDGHFTPALYFENVAIFGAGDIKSHAKSISSFSTPAELARIPQLSYRKAPDGSIQSKFNWVTELDSLANRKLTFTVERTRKPDSLADQPDKISCVLENYQVNTNNSTVDVGRVEYSSTNKESPKTKCDIAPNQIGFGGALRFLAELASKLGTINIQAEAHIYDGILVMYFRVRFPEARFGVFKLHNLVVLTTVSVGYLGTRGGIDFRIADPSDPCSLSVDFLGQTLFYGKGYFVYRQSLAPIPCPPSIDCAFEFGAGLSFGIGGLASLSVQVSAGIQFRLNMEHSVELIGYLHCYGSMNVLGIINVSVGFDAALTLRGLQLCCSVSLHVEIDLFLFSISVDVPVEFCFGGSSGGIVQNQQSQRPQAALHHGEVPAPADFMKFEEWKDYCSSFA